MRINWVFSAKFYPGPEIDLEGLRGIGPSWGSDRSWRACETDNVICDDFGRGRELLNRQFQNRCNFYIPRRHFQSFGRPEKVKVYDGEFTEEVTDIEDIVAMHLAASQSDLLLLAGFDLSSIPDDLDRMERHRAWNRIGLIRSIIAADPDIQWVAVDHANKLDKRYNDLPNLTRDTMENVLKLLL